MRAKRRPGRRPATCISTPPAIPLRALPSTAHWPQEFRENPPNVYGFGHQAYLTHVVDAIVNGSPSLVGGLEGRKSLELISAIYESIETGKEVPLRFRPKLCRLGEG